MNSLPTGTFILTMTEGLADIQKNRQFEIVKSGKDFGISRLNAGFLNKNTRQQQGNDYYLLKLL